MPTCHPLACVTLLCVAAPTFGAVEIGQQIHELLGDSRFALEPWLRPQETRGSRRSELSFDFVSHILGPVSSIPGHFGYNP